MLALDFRIARSLRGLDPEAGGITAERVRKWIEKHPVISEAERARLRAQGQNKIAVHGGFGNRKGQIGLAREGSAPDVVSAEEGVGP
jgi:hypothetical protein